jgi:superfamily I DNA and/or RNA helicase
VGTIHTFQGREKKVIIFDTVMSGENSYGRRRHYSVRPFDEEKNGLAVPRLLNVALSRSKNRLVILADMDHINKVYANKFLGELLRRFQKTGQ